MIDSGIKSGLESYCIKRHLELIGVFPQNQVLMPKINPTQIFANELTNGHTYLFGIEDKDCKDWGDECQTKFKIAE